MAQLQPTPELNAALVQRLTAEMGQTFVSNCALDLVLDAQIARVAELEKLLEDEKKKSEDMAQSNTKLRELVESLRGPKPTRRK